MSKGAKQLEIEINNLLKNDPVTKAIDEANEILGKLGMKVGDVTPTKENHNNHDHLDKFDIYEGKVYTEKTLEKLQKLKKLMPKRILGLEKLHRECFDSDEQYAKYVKAHIMNNEAGDDVLGDSYTKAIWDLLNLFIKEKNTSEETIKSSPDYEKFSGTQVEMATGFYKHLQSLK